MKALITGATGQVGRALLAAAPAGVQFRALSHAELDITDREAVRACIVLERPDVVLNAAAYTAVDQAESEAAAAEAINALAPRSLAEAVRTLPGCRLLHVSTDYVFDGCSERPYRPEDPTGPLGVYGRTKLEGERAVLATLGERAALLRTAWVYAAQGRNFLLTILRLMRERGSVRVVADQRGTPTAAASIATALWRLAERPQVCGLLHWTDAGPASWYEFALAIAEEALALGLLAGPVRVEPISSAEYPTAARRPAHSVLDCTAAARQLGLEPRPWRESLREVMLSVVPMSVPR